MPASSRSLGLTDRYRDRAANAASVAAVRVARLWPIVNPDDLDATFGAFANAAAVQTAGVQTFQANLASQYLGGFVTEELGRQVDAIVPAADMVGVDEFGRPLSVAFVPPLLTVKVALAQAKGLEMALAAGLVRAQRVAQTAAAWSGRAALAGQMTASPHVVGWRRATPGAPCGACLAAATGAVRDTQDVPDVHGGCRCVAEPVVRGVRDRAPRPTGEELFGRMSRARQDALFDGRGGERKAQLLRDGMPLERLLTRQPLALGGHLIAETPLEQLAA